MSCWEARLAAAGTAACGKTRADVPSAAKRLEVNKTFESELVISRSHQDDYRLRVSWYDRASSLLLSLLIMLGVVVFVLFFIWLSGRIFISRAAVPVQLTELGNSDSALGAGVELEPSTDEELGPDSELNAPMPAETLASIADAVGSQVAVLDDPRLNGQEQWGGRGDGRLAGRGTGSGVARRWELRFIEGNTLETYARQLDFFAVELAVLMPGNKVVYAYHLTKAKPDTRTGPADAEKRYYLTWRRGELQAADRALLDRAGVQCDGRIILKFLPAKVEARLADLEKSHAERKADNVSQTRFGIRAVGDRYEFFVLEQSYRE